MKALVFILLVAHSCSAKPISITDTHGRTIDVEILSVSDEVAKVRMNNGKVHLIPFSELDEASRQAAIATVAKSDATPTSSAEPKLITETGKKKYFPGEPISNPEYPDFSSLEEKLENMTNPIPTESSLQIIPRVNREEELKRMELEINRLKIIQRQIESKKAIYEIEKEAAETAQLEEVVKVIPTADDIREAARQALMRYPLNSKVVAYSKNWLIPKGEPIASQSTGQQDVAGDVVVEKNSVYITKIDEVDNDVIKLANGGLVQVTTAYLGYIGYRKDAVLYNNGKSCRIWIEGKKDFPCDVLKLPATRPSGKVEVCTVTEVKDNGKMLITLDKRIFKVSYLYTGNVILWLGPFDALLIDGNRLLRLDEGSGIIEVVETK